ncbi:MerR family transcriptional regulator [Streptomyces hygroscopicus]|uniref:MerR family transcriptional regulator n=1 Tax=Streptomyces hygroscopicus TaxID=1912 RepID=UPI003802B996
MAPARWRSRGQGVRAGRRPQTGYRSYTFEQVEQAMLITVLRGTGMSVKLVRRALDKPDVAPALLRQHSAEVRHQRQTQDEALSDVREFFNSWPRGAAYLYSLIRPPRKRVWSSRREVFKSDLGAGRWSASGGSCSRA